jgi:hypothetical protein
MNTFDAARFALGVICMSVALVYLVSNWVWRGQSRANRAQTTPSRRGPSLVFMVVPIFVSMGTLASGNVAFLVPAAAMVAVDPASWALVRYIRGRR